MHKTIPLMFSEDSMLFPSSNLFKRTKNKAKFKTFPIIFKISTSDLKTLKIINIF